MLVSSAQATICLWMKPQLGSKLIIADNNLLTIEAAMELGCFLVVAALAASYTLEAITHA